MIALWPILWRLARQAPGLYLRNVALGLAVSLLDLAAGPATRAFFDALGRRAAGPGAETAVALLVAIALARTLTKTNAVLADVRCEFTVDALLRRHLLDGILARPGARALVEPVGETVGRFRDDVPQLGVLLSYTWVGIDYLLFAAGALALLLRTDARLTALVFPPMAAVVLLTRRAYGRIERYRAAGRQAGGRVTGLIGEMFEAVRAIQVAGAEADVVAHFRALNEERQRTMLRDSVLTRALDSVFANLADLGTGLVLLAGAAAMRRGSFSVGDFALFVYYLGWVGYVTQFAGEFLAQQRRTGVALARLLAPLPGAGPAALLRPRPFPGGELPMLPVPTTRPADRLERLEATGLGYQHPESGRGVADISLRLERGSFTVVTGPVGAGKTTLLRALLGLLPTDAGQVRWNGAAVVEPAEFFVPPRAAYVPQVPRLLSETLRDNLLLGLPAATDLAAAIERAVLAADVAALEAGLDTFVGPRGVRLSGGQVQRAAAARALARRPELLVLDDLSSALDAATEEALWERLLGPGDLTCLAVSHRQAALRRADRVIVLEAGRVVAAGPPAQLLATSAELRPLWAGEVRAEESEDVAR